MAAQYDLRRLYRVELESAVGPWKRPDVMEWLTWAIIVTFFICVFYNITYLSSADHYTFQLATIYLGIASLGGIGLAVRTAFNIIPVRNAQGKILQVGIAKSVHEAGLRSIGRSLGWAGLAFGVQSILSFIIMRLPLSIYGGLSVQHVVMGIMAAVGEELFFSYFATGVMLNTKLKWGTIPIVSLTFAWYHWQVYQTITALLLVLVMRLVYSIIYLFSRRLSSVMLAHVMHNILANVRL